MTYIIYFITIVNNMTVIIDTMPVANEKACIEIVTMINSQPSISGRRVRSACYIKND